VIILIGHAEPRYQNHPANPNHPSGPFSFQRRFLPRRLVNLRITPLRIPGMDVEGIFLTV
jgi:hypothetical protein